MNKIVNPNSLAIVSLIHNIQNYLQDNRDACAEICQVIHGLSQLELSREAETYQESFIPPNLKGDLDRGIEIVSKVPSLISISEALSAAYVQLNWKVDKGLFYAEDAELGQAFVNGNMHCELIGPDNCFFIAKDFRLGIFLLKPGVLYRDHNHKAPEFYLSLTGPHQWRFDHGPWRRHEAGSVLWNTPNKIHATQVGDNVFLSIYCWTRDVSSMCYVMPKENLN